MSTMSLMMKEASMYWTLAIFVWFRLLLCCASVCFVFTLGLCVIIVFPVAMCPPRCLLVLDLLHITYTLVNPVLLSAHSRPLMLPVKDQLRAVPPASLLSRHLGNPCHSCTPDRENPTSPWLPRGLCFGATPFPAATPLPLSQTPLWGGQAHLSVVRSSWCYMSLSISLLSALLCTNICFLACTPRFA